MVVADPRNGVIMKLFVVTGFIFCALNVHAGSDTKSIGEKVYQLHNTLHANSCDFDREFPIGPEVFALDSKNSLILIPCLFGAYQGSHMAYIVSNNAETVKPVLVLSYDDSVKALVPSFDLTTASFDEKTGKLSTFAKGRGLGDCGQTSVSEIKKSTYGDYTVKTVEIRNKSECDGDYEAEWTLVFKQ